MSSAIKSKRSLAGLSLACILLFSLAVVWTYLSIVGVGPVRSDTASYADPGLQIAQGKGFVTRRIFTAFLPYISDLKSRPLLAPYMERPLFQPWYDALVFKFFGASEWTVALANVPLFLVLLVSVFLLTREIFDEWAGLLAVLLCLLDPMQLFVSTLGVTEVAFTASIVLSFYGVAKGARSGGWGPLVLTCLAAAFTQYARPVGFAYLVPLLLFLFLSHRERRWQKVFLVLGSFLILTLPITLRSWYLFGSGNIHAVHLILFMTPSFPGLSAYYSLDVPHSMWAVVTSYGWQIARKWAKWMFAYVVFLYRMTNPGTVAAAVVGGLWLGRTNRLVASLGWSLFVAYGLTAATQSFVAWSPRHVSQLVPLVSVLASGTIVAAWRLWAGKLQPLSRAILAFAGALLLIYPLATYAHQNYKGKASRQEAIKTYHAFGEFIKSHIGPEEVVATDASLAVAWYGQRTSMTLPVDLPTARRVREQYLPFTAIVLTSSRVENPHFVSDETWRKAYRGEAEPLDFTIRDEFDEGGLRAVLLRPRGWSAKL